MKSMNLLKIKILFIILTLFPLQSYSNSFFIDIGLLPAPVHSNSDKLLFGGSVNFIHSWQSYKFRLYRGHITIDYEDDTPCTNSAINEVAALFGYSKNKKWTSYSFFSGLSFILYNNYHARDFYNEYETCDEYNDNLIHVKSVIGLPLEIDFMFITKFLGIGVHGFGNINTENPFLHGGLKFRFGKIK